METNWASDHLQTIRTLMERSAIYRRALAPVMMVSGGLGAIGALAAYVARIEGDRMFSLFWLAVGLVTLGAALLLVRKQAIKEGESFWSLPTRRVASALLPPFLVGFAAGIHIALRGGTGSASLLAAAWVAAYGCALHSAGFFMQRGIKLFGWACLGCGCLVLLLMPITPALQSTNAAHGLMGAFFGLLHVAYGAYLHVTEKQRTGT
jgi:hypothetical protein